MTDSTIPIVTGAIDQACSQNGQSDDVAKKIIKWVETGLSRDLDAEDMLQFARVVVNSIKIKD